jgi:hypothetical protein
MKKLLAVAGLTVAAVVLIAPLTVDAAAGKHDFAVGGFQGTGDNNVGFSAQSDADGANPFGHLSQTIPQVRKDRFRVTCLAVSGNEAAIGLTPANAQTAQNYPTGRVLAVRDNGNPTSGQPVDEYAYILGTSAANCANYVGSAAFVPVNGNILVHDVP